MRLTQFGGTCKKGGCSLGACLASKPRFYTQQESTTPPPICMIAPRIRLTRWVSRSLQPLSVSALVRTARGLRPIARGHGCATTGSLPNGASGFDLRPPLVHVRRDSDQVRTASSPQLRRRVEFSQQASDALSDLISDHANLLDGLTVRVG